MATNFVNFDNLNYCGKEANEIFSKMIWDLDLANTGITMRDNLKGKEKIYTGKIGDVWQKYTCPFTPKGEASLAESYIEPVEIKVNMEQCFDTFWHTFMTDNTRITLNGGIPEPFNNWFFNEQLVPRMKKEYQEIFWKGDTESEKEHLSVTDGVEKLLKEDGANTITGTKFTVSNIISQVEAAVMKAQEVAADEDVEITDEYKIFINKNDLIMLINALGINANSPLTNQVWSNFVRNGEKVYAYGFEVVPTEQSRNTIIVGPVRNLILGFDSIDATTYYRIIDMRETTGDNMFRVLALQNIAVAVLLPELFVYSYVS